MIVQEFYEINGRQFVRTYSDANRYSEYILALPERYNIIKEE